MNKQTICKKCNDAELELRTKESVLEIEGAPIRITGVEYLECPNCGYQSIPAELARRNDKKFVDARREALGLLTSGEIAAARGKHGLTQATCSRLLGGGANSFNKYESGAVTQSEPMDLLVRLIRDVPGTLTYVAQLKGVAGIAEHHAGTEAPSKLLGELPCVEKAAS